MKKDLMQQYNSMAIHNMNIKIQWNEYLNMTIDSITRHRRYIELIMVDHEGELHYIKCTYREFANLILGGGY